MAEKLIVPPRDLDLEAIVDIMKMVNGIDQRLQQVEQWIDSQDTYQMERRERS